MEEVQEEEVGGAVVGVAGTGAWSSEAVEAGRGGGRSQRQVVCEATWVSAHGSPRLASPHSPLTAGSRQTGGWREEGEVRGARAERKRGRSVRVRRQREGCERMRKKRKAWKPSQETGALGSK